MYDEHLHRQLRRQSALLLALHSGEMSCKDKFRLHSFLSPQKDNGAVLLSDHAVGVYCRYNMYGDISMRAAEEMRKKEV